MRIDRSVDSGRAQLVPVRECAYWAAALVTDDVVGVDLERREDRPDRHAALHRPHRHPRHELALQEARLAREDELSGRGVSWCATCDGFFFREKVIAVVGADSAIEEIAFVTRFAQKVYLLHRRDELRASKIMQARAFADPELEIVWNADVGEILGEHAVDGITLRHTAMGETRRLHVSGLFDGHGGPPSRCGSS